MCIFLFITRGTVGWRRTAMNYDFMNTPSSTIAVEATLYRFMT
jgi:hypothetical protein